MYYKPRLDDNLLAEYSSDLYITTACLGSRFSQLILNNRTPEAELLLDHHRAIFGDSLLVELQLHENDEQRLVNETLLKLADKKNLTIILTNDAHYMHEHDKLLHEQLLCIQSKYKMSDPKRFSFGDIDVHLASHDWMAERASRLGIPYEAISNTQYIADSIDHASYFSDAKLHWPKFPLPDNTTSWDHLAKVAKQGLLKRFDNVRPPQEYIDRLNYELKVLKQMDYSDYMLLVANIINKAKDENILVGPGRGSSGGALVAYATGITEVDPIKYGLLFARFCNYGRSGIPQMFTEEMKNAIN